MCEPSDKDILRLARQDLVAMPGYASVEPPEILAKRLGIPEERIVKRDGYENPYGSSTKVREALASFPRYNIYPDQEQRRKRGAGAGTSNPGTRRASRGITGPANWRGGK